MKTYTLSWVAVLLIALAMLFFEGLVKVLAVALVIISAIALFQNRGKIELNVNVGKDNTDKK